MSFFSFVDFQLILSSLTVIQDEDKQKRLGGVNKANYSFFLYV